MTTRSLGAKNKHKGSHAERFYATLFKEMGYDKCQTARFGSRLHDNAGIDLINLPFNVQIKAGVQKNLSPGKVLLNMTAQINALFMQGDPVRSYPLLLIYRPKPFSNNTDEDKVYMSREQWDMYKDRVLVMDNFTILKRKNKMNNPYGEIVCTSFNSLRNVLLPEENIF